MSSRYKYTTLHQPPFIYSLQLHTLCSLLPANSSCRSLALSSSLVLCLICSCLSALSCSFSSFIAEIFVFSSRTCRSISYANLSILNFKHYMHISVSKSQALCRSRYTKKYNKFLLFPNRMKA